MIWLDLVQGKLYRKPPIPSDDKNQVPWSDSPANPMNDLMGWFQPFQPPEKIRVSWIIIPNMFENIIHSKQPMILTDTNHGAVQVRVHRSSTSKKRSLWEAVGAPNPGMMSGFDGTRMDQKFLAEDGTLLEAQGPKGGGEPKLKFWWWAWKHDGILMGFWYAECRLPGDLAGFQPMTICFQPRFKMPRELGAFEWKITVLDPDMPLPLLKQE